MEHNVRKYLKYIAILEDSMRICDLFPIQRHRPQELDKIFTVDCKLEDIYRKIDEIVLENKEDSMSIEIEDGLFTVNIQGNLVHNLTLGQATAIAELHLVENDFPNPVLVFQQTVKSSWEFEFVKYLGIRKVITYATQYPESYELLASKSLQDIKDLYI